MDKTKKFLEKLGKRFVKHADPKSIQVTISVSFTITAVCIMCFLGILLYQQFARKTELLYVENTEQLLNQTAISLEDYLRSMRRISDAMYYSVIKDKDLATEGLDEEMDLLYEANKDNLVSIACYARDGGLVAAAPIANMKAGISVTDQEWFQDAVDQLENFHFSTPHVQNLFDDPSYRYHWVVSLSRTVELTNNGGTMQGVLLVDMNYSSIKQLLEKVNQDISKEYVYLMDRNGEIIYHPKQNLIRTGLLGEDNQDVSGYEDGTTREHFEKENRMVTVKTISYTGWKLVGVVPAEQVLDNYGQILLFFFFIVLFSIFLLVFVNLRLSEWITAPMKKLDRAVRELEAGQEGVDFSVNGPHELEHLSRSIQSMVSTLRHLMDDILEQEEQKRRSELDVLQSQINPHFLYNTLDSVVWMTENGRTEDAVVMLTALARFFRISLSRGSNIIPIADELEHARHYLTIQKMRYKNKFSADITAESGVESLYTIKLIIQPILENAIYHGMAYADGDGEIHIRAFRDGEDVIIEVADNGPGMPEDLVEQLLSPHGPAVSGAKGSGIGFRNVHQRIQLTFGPTYGLTILSEPDSGTTVRIRIPALDESAAAAYRKEGPV